MNAQVGTQGAPQFASLYVGDLDAEVTEAMLYEIFNTVGPVASIRVCRDSVTRRSLGYAYVNFHSAADAERVMDTLNYSNIKGRCCRIMWSHRDPNLRKTGQGNVFVKNLDKNVDNKALYDTFSLFGNILSCKVATDFEGKTKGYGFVHYETAEAAKQAIEKVNGMQIGEKTVFVGEFIPRDSRAPQEIANFTNVYIKNMPEEWDEEKCVGVFAEYGTVTSHMFNTDKKGRAFCFLNYETSEDAKKAIEAQHCKDLRSDEEKKEFPEGKPKEDVPEGQIDPDDHPEHLLYVQRAQSKTEREKALKEKFAKAKGSSGTDNPSEPKGVNLYIKNIADEMSDEKLRELFVPHGEITSARIMKDEKGRSKGFGFVCYKTPEEAAKAVTEMHLKSMNGKPLYVGLAEKKEERQGRLAARYKGGIKGYDDNTKGGMMMGKGGMAQGGMGQPGVQPGMQGNMQGGMQGGAMYFGAQQKGMPPQPMQMGPGGRPMMIQGQQGGAPAMMGRPLMMGPGGPAGPMGYPLGNPMMMNQQMKGMPQPGGKGMAMNPMMQAGKGGMNPMMQAPRQMDPRMQGRPGNNEQLTAQHLSNLQPGVQKQMIGEKLFPAVSRIQPDLAGKITGMMLEMDNNELLRLLDNQEQLNAKVEEAVRVLNNMNTGGQPRS